MKVAILSGSVYGTAEEVARHAERLLALARRRLLVAGGPPQRPQRAVRADDDADRARRRSLTVGDQDPQLMSRLTATLDPMTRAMLDVVLAAWAAPGVNNPGDENSPTGTADGVDPSLLRDAARRRRDADKVELAEELIVRRHFALALEHADRDRLLVIISG